MEDNGLLEPSDRSNQVPQGNALRVEYIRAIVALAGIVGAVVLGFTRTSSDTVLASLGTASVSYFFGHATPPRKQE